MSFNRLMSDPDERRAEKISRENDAKLKRSNAGTISARTAGTVIAVSNIVFALALISIVVGIGYFVGNTLGVI